MITIAKINTYSCSSNLNLFTNLDDQTNFPTSRRRLAFNPIVTRKAAAAACNMLSSQSEGGTLYEILGINSERGKTATLSDIKKAYKQMARIYHPDVSPPGSEDKYTQIFIKLKQAYETLSDSHSKAFYDLNLPSQESWKEEGRLKWQSQLEQLNQRRRRTTAP